MPAGCEEELKAAKHITAQIAIPINCFIYIFSIFIYNSKINLHSLMSLFADFSY